MGLCCGIGGGGGRVQFRHAQQLSSPFNGMALQPMVVYDECWVGQSTGGVDD